MCARLPDVYAPGFEVELRRRVEPELRPRLADRMLIGYFVGNEPVWTFTGHHSPFGELFTSPDYPHTRGAALAWLRERYHDRLADLNAAWGTSFAAWEDLQRGIPDPRTGATPLLRCSPALMCFASRAECRGVPPLKAGGVLLVCGTFRSMDRGSLRVCGL